MSDQIPQRDTPGGRGSRETRRAHYARGLPDYHDPTAGFGGAPPAQSALTLRLVLAIFGVVVCGGGAAALAVADAPVGFVVAACVVGLLAVVNIAVVGVRKARGEPG